MSGAWYIILMSLTGGNSRTRSATTNPQAETLMIIIVGVALMALGYIGVVGIGRQDSIEMSWALVVAVVGIVAFGGAGVLSLWAAFQSSVFNFIPTAILLYLAYGHMGWDGTWTGLLFFGIPGFFFLWNGLQGLAESR